ncbi:MAG: hypothetical protein AB1486_31805 [Planctomycetota bacterium]
MRVLSIVVLLVFSLAPLSSSRDTWIVAKDGSGDFTEIQDAIAAAAPGDLILVKSGTYKGIIVDKPLTIVGSGVDRTVVVQDYVVQNQGVLVYIPEATGDVLVASAKVLGGSNAVRAQGPEVRVVLFRLLLDLSNSGSSCSLGALDAAWVANCVTAPESYPGPPDAPAALGLYQVNPAFVTQCYFKSEDADIFGPFDGGPGIGAVSSSTAYVAETDSIGGAGGWGWDCRDTTGGDGGDGILIETGSRAFIFGRDTTVIQAGDGGKGYAYDPYCDDPAGGDGGDGIRTSGGAEGTYSGVTPVGGQGGEGSPPGRDGSPTSGNVSHKSPRLPTSTMEGEGRPGTAVSFSFHAAPGDTLLLVYSTQVDVLDLQNFEGHPLQPSPAGTFGVVPLGIVPDTGTATVSATIPLDAPLGEPFYVQGILLGAHPPELTNMSMVVITPDW